MSSGKIHSLGYMYVPFRNDESKERIEKKIKNSTPMVPSTPCHFSIYFSILCMFSYVHMHRSILIPVYIYIFFFASWITLFVDSVSSLIVHIKSIFLCHKTHNGESGNSDKIKHMILFSSFFLSLREIGAFERYKHLI